MTQTAQAWGGREGACGKDGLRSCSEQRAPMIAYTVRRLLLAAVTIWAISMLSFVIIQLPPGDFVDAYIAHLSASGSSVSAEEAQSLRILYGLDRPVYLHYGKWLSRVAEGDFGESMEWQRPVT